MLVWAGLIESFVSQYHEPVIPYMAKILFGCVELILLCLFYAKSGTKEFDKEASSPEMPLEAQPGPQ